MRQIIGEKTEGERMLNDDQTDKKMNYCTCMIVNCHFLSMKKIDDS